MEKEYRIKDSKEIEKLLSFKQRLSTKNLILYYKENETKKFRCAVSASKKIGNAVVRNYQKRRIREVVRKLKDRLLNFDIFIICKDNILNITYSELEKDILYLLQKGKIIKRNDEK